MKLGISAIGFGAKLRIDMKLIHHAESLGFDSTWTAEAYGNDAVTTATWIAAKTERIRVGTAIMQMPARTPAMAAMTAMSLDQLSGADSSWASGLRDPGRRRMAWCSLWEASHSHARIHRDHS